MSDNTYDDQQYYHILIIDDLIENIEPILSYIQNYSYKIVTVSTGLEGLKYAEQHKPELILLDVMMPDIDGFETCLMLKKNTVTRDIPVIFMTALSDTVDKIKGFKSGGVDYITKPLNIEELMARVQTHINLRRMQKKNEAINEHQKILLEKIKDVNATKDKFFSIITHDMKGAFSELISISELLFNMSDSIDKDTSKQLVLTLHKSAKNTFKLLENLVVWAQIQQNIFEFEPQIFDINYLVNINIAKLKNYAHKKSIELINSVDSNIFVYADMGMINTVMNNLINNAIKYSHADGKVRISSSQTGDYIGICISDNGIGISKEDIGSLFKIHKKNKSLGTDGEIGTGLGLILCKEMIDKNNGRITVECDDNGSSFRLFLPCKEQ